MRERAKNQGDENESISPGIDRFGSDRGKEAEPSRLERTVSSYANLGMHLPLFVSILIGACICVNWDDITAKNHSSAAMSGVALKESNKTSTSIICVVRGHAKTVRLVQGITVFFMLLLQICADLP